MNKEKNNIRRFICTGVGKSVSLDYCFASRELVELLKSVEIGDYKS